MQSNRRSFDGLSSCGCRHLCRRAVTLIEVLTVLGVISLLAAILLPAVQSARERARRVQCVDHLRQIGVAIHAHESTHGRLPYTSMLMGEPERPDRSVHSSLLPWLDQSAIADKIDPAVYFLDAPSQPLGKILVREPDEFAANELQATEWYEIAVHHVPVFRCASDGVLASGGNNYRACLGSWPHVLWPEATGPELDQTWNGAWAFARTLTFADFADGTSNTAMFSERVIGDQNGDVYDPFRDYAFHGSPVTPEEAFETCAQVTVDWPEHDSFLGSTWLFGGWRQTWYSHAFPPNATLPDCGGGPISIGGGPGAFTARSFHDGGVNVLFADGRATFVASTVDLTVWRGLGTRAGSRLDPPEAIVSFP
ncbi:MAG: DUF1559 domain-containing protein [Planctomycetota bacterium]|nr:MAG: DUF1559 domain-containing protein [Planctomycetota bacterium]REK20023.1 MAG: DUF1559 domain-containing protein [Planctomycetota bacterium]REK27590.1 MAG: DUF1559 domain-containing protein [Planctomycetota bacterium]